MVVATADPSEPGSAKATIGRVQYAVPVPGEKDLYTYLYDLPDGKPASNIARDDRTVPISDIRPKLSEFSLSKNGVELHKLSVPEDINWDDETEVSPRLFPPIANIPKKQFT